MSALLQTAEQMLVNRIISNAMPFTGRTKAGLGLAALTGLLVLTGFGFLVYAAFLWMNANYEPQVAAFYAGAGAFALAIITTLAAYLIMQYKQRRAEKARQELLQTIHLAMDVADEELSKPINENPKTTLLLASLAGYILADRFL